MSFNAPTPGSFCARFAEDRKIIELGIAREFASGAFHVEENVLKAHDVSGFIVAVSAEPGGEERVRKLALRGRHFFYGQAIAGFRDEMPIASLVALEIKLSLCLLLIIERRKKLVRCLGHLVGGLMGA